MTGIPVLASNRSATATGSGADAERMNRTDAGTVSSGSERAEARDDGGHRVDPGDGTAGHEVPEAAAVEAVVEDQAGAGHQGRQQAHDLGVDVEERQRIEPAVVCLELQV